MVSSALGRLRSADALRWLPMVVLLASLASLFALGGDRSYFYRSGNHNYNSAKTMAIAENLSPAHGFRLFSRVSLYEDGGARYKFYSRFPVGGYALVKFAALPFGDDLTAKILAGRALALVLFGGAALAAYLAVRRVASDGWVALTATLFAFSGYYALYYSDGIFNEGVMDLFGLTLVFHGMVVFAQEGRFRQLLIKTVAALLLGWHVYALLLPFIALGFGGEVWARMRPFVSRARDSESGGDDEAPPSVRAVLGTLVSSRYLALGAVSLALGVALLAFNLANEYTAFDGERSLTELPTSESILKRFGQDADFNDFWADELAWGPFIARQFMRVGGVSTPYALAEWTGGFDFPQPRAVPFAAAALGVLIVAGALAGAVGVRRIRAMPASFRRCRLPLVAATLAGFCWAIPLRHNTYDRTQDFESLFYAGAPLTLFALALAFAKARLGERFGKRAAVASLAVAAAVAAALFAVSAHQVGQLEADASNAAFQKALIAEFADMRGAVRGKTVTLSSDIERWADGARYFAVYYYLSGSFLEHDVTLYESDFPQKPPRAADFMASRYRDDDFGLLTPDNRTVFLYSETDLDDLYRAKIRRLESAEPAARADFDVYADGKTLTYLKRDCVSEEAERWFFLHAFPLNPCDLPDERRASGFYGANFRFADRGKVVDGACVLMADLPIFPVATFTTGQYVPGGGEIWSASAKPQPDAETLAAYEDAYAAVASSQPAARSDWDVYLDGDTVAYLKAPCDEDDTRGRFLLSVYPKNLGDIPEDRRALGHESLNFDFERRGAMFGGKCMVMRALPDYGVSRVETGQWVPGGERLWTAELAVGD